MSRCLFCGEQIEWRHQIPYSGEVDHREICAGMVRPTREKVRAANHEARVNEFLRKSSNATSQNGSRAHGKPARSKRSG